MSSEEEAQPGEDPVVLSSTLESERELYTKTLTYNVIGRYDPKVNVLLFHTSHCQLYKFNESQEWEKLDYQGVLALYSRAANPDLQTREKESDFYDHGLIILNRSSPENFSLGLLSNTKSKEFGVPEIKTEYQTNYIIIKNLDGDIYGFWIHEVNDRETVFSLVKAIIQQ